MTRRILSVDPGDPSGWALWELLETGAWKLLAFGELADPDGPSINTLLGRLLPDWRGAELVVEAQWYRNPEPVVRAIRHAKGPGKRERRWRSPSSGRVLEVDIVPKRGGAPWDAVAKIVASRARWEAICGLAGLRLHAPVAPGKWIPAMTKGHPERDTHKRVRAVCNLRWAGRFDRLGYAEAAALLLGEWWIVEHRGRILRGEGPVRGRRGIPEAA